jgi:hypothetical protein
LPLRRAIHVVEVAALDARTTDALIVGMKTNSPRRNESNIAVELYLLDQPHRACRMMKWQSCCLVLRSGKSLIVSG